MEETFHLLANPNFHQRKVFKEHSIDNSILILLNKKFPYMKITEEDYNKNILKIENLFVETHKQKFIDNLVKEIVDQAINEQVLL